MSDIEPDHVVLRAAADLPPGVLPSDLDGRWYDRSEVHPGCSFAERMAAKVAAVPTGRFEVREHDGAVAEVWEVRP